VPSKNCICSCLLDEGLISYKMRSLRSINFLTRVVQKLCFLHPPATGYKKKWIMYDLWAPNGCHRCGKISLHGSLYKSTITLSRAHRIHSGQKGNYTRRHLFPPLLFLIYMEPLLQWLHRGVGGYEHGCTKDMRPQTDLERLTNRISSG
jgi:hypothetical protein